MNLSQQASQQNATSSLAAWADSEVENLLYKIEIVLNQTLTVAMMVMSVVGNTLATLVLSRRAFRHLPTSVYLRFLAVMDAGTVVTGLTHRFTLAVADYDFRATGNIPCQLQVFTVYVFTELSAWTLIVVTSERVVCILKPHKVKLLCTKFKSYVILVSLTVIFFTANLPILFIFGRKYVYDPVLNVTIEEPCVPISTDEDLNKVWFMSHFIKQSLVPFIIIFVMNIIMIVGLFKRKEFVKESMRSGGGGGKKRQISAKSQGNSSTAESMTPSTSVQSVSSTTQIVVTSQPTSGEGSSSQAASRRETALTKNLIMVNVVFLMCTFPIGIYQQIVPRPPEKDLDPPSETIVFSMLVFVLYLNNTLNIFLYCANGSRFKKELSSMLKEMKLFCKGSQKYS
ncbi:thyrotropin-releasing hormone receptor [Aplysia californica]|uniref:Thyrotropin-releasing hormone receptor n=1 Tax=Aplysia californica TaxID=6500 RepID=A0ABM0JVG2_APLCA|nr:thyrotropin-releasing hormone receptor [Aplysia californica]